MINETTTTLMQNVTFESWTRLTTSVPFIIVMLATWLIPIVLLLIIASLTHARTSNGTVLKSRMISRSEIWVALGIWIFIQGLFIVTFIIFPVFLKFI